MVKNLAEKVLSTGKAVAMASMSSYERRLCHMTLAEIEGVVGESEGEGEDRHLVIKKA
jgi:spoIIIJ-associated protein